jgi:hypothetical protein
LEVLLDRQAAETINGNGNGNGIGNVASVAVGAAAQAATAASITATLLDSVADLTAAEAALRLGIDLDVGIIDDAEPQVYVGPAYAQSVVGNTNYFPAPQVVQQRVAEQVRSNV